MKTEISAAVSNRWINFYPTMYQESFGQALWTQLYQFLIDEKHPKNLEAWNSNNCIYSFCCSAAIFFRIIKFIWWKFIEYLNINIQFTMMIKCKNDNLWKQDCRISSFNCLAWGHSGCSNHLAARYGRRFSGALIHTCIECVLAESLPISLSSFRKLARPDSVHWRVSG